MLVGTVRFSLSAGSVNDFYAGSNGPLYDSVSLQHRSSTMNDKRRIEPRPGLEVFPNEGGTISIKQIGALAGDEQIVVVHPEDVPKLVAMLERECELIAEEEVASAE
jgi:hypothetical protein